MKIAFASDHGGLELKNEVVKYVVSVGHEIEDYGTFNKESCDYPDFAKQAAQAVADGKCDRGILVCTTGIGVSMVANKIKGIRCALCTNVDMATMTRKHNDANMIAMGQKYVTADLAKQIIDAFLNTPFEGGRHAVRVDKIEQ